MCVSAQFLLHGSPPFPLLWLFIAQLSLFSLRCILGKRGGERKDDGQEEAWVNLKGEEGRTVGECTTVSHLGHFVQHYFKHEMLYFTYYQGPAEYWKLEMNCHGMDVGVIIM